MRLPYNGVAEVTGEISRSRRYQAAAGSWLNACQQADKTSTGPGFPLVSLGVLDSDP